MITAFARALARRPFVALVLALTGIGGGRLNLLMPLVADDYARGGRSLATIPTAVAAEYMGWTGRAFVTALTYLALASPATVFVFDALNALMFCALLVAAFRVARGRAPATLADACELTIFAALLWLGSDAIAHSALWKTGAIGYLWVVTANLVVAGHIADVHDTAASDRAAPGALASALLCVVALFAGNGLEHIAAPMIVVIAVIVADRARRLVSRRPAPRLPLAMLAAYICGFAVCMAAPGNAVRLDFQTGTAPVVSVARMISFSGKVLDHVLHTPFAGVFALAAALAIFTKPSRAPWRRAALMAAIACGTAVVIAPLSYPRVFNIRFAFPFDVFMLTAAFALLPQPPLGARYGALLAGACAVAAGAVAVDAAVVFRDYEGVAAQAREREALIAAAKPRGTPLISPPEGIFFPDYMGGRTRTRERAAFIEASRRRRRTQLAVPVIVLPSTGAQPEWSGRAPGSDIGADPQWWANLAFADYYGLAGVIGVLPPAAAEDDDDDDDDD